MNMTKRKLKDIMRIALIELDKKKADELKKLNEKYKEMKEEANKKYRRRVVQTLPKFLTPEHIGSTSHNWSGTQFWVNVEIDKDTYNYFNEPFEEVEKWYSRKREGIIAKYNELNKKVLDWYDETYKQLVLSGETDLPSWLKDLLGMEE